MFLGRACKWIESFWGTSVYITSDRFMYFIKPLMTHMLPTASLNKKKGNISVLMYQISKGNKCRAEQ